MAKYLHDQQPLFWPIHKLTLVVILQKNSAVVLIYMEIILQIKLNLLPKDPSLKIYQTIVMHELYVIDLIKPIQNKKK